MKTEFPSLITEHGQSAVLRSVQAEGHLQGLLLTMKLKQVFRNDSSENLEVTYSFPVA